MISRIRIRSAAAGGESKDALGAWVGAEFRDGIKREDHLVACHTLVVDIDEMGDVRKCRRRPFAACARSSTRRFRLPMTRRAAESFSSLRARVRRRSIERRGRSDRAAHALGHRPRPSMLRPGATVLRARPPPRVHLPGRVLRGAAHRCGGDRAPSPAPYARPDRCR